MPPPPPTTSPHDGGATSGPAQGSHGTAAVQAYINIDNEQVNKWAFDPQPDRDLNAYLEPWMEGNAQHCHHRLTIVSHLQAIQLRALAL